MDLTKDKRTNPWLTSSPPSTRLLNTKLSGEPDDTTLLCGDRSRLYPPVDPLITLLEPPSIITVTP